MKKLIIETYKYEGDNWGDKFGWNIYVGNTENENYVIGHNYFSDHRTKEQAIEEAKKVILTIKQSRDTVINE